MACQIPQLPPNPYKPDVKKSDVPAPAGILHAQGAENALVMVALSSKHQLMQSVTENHKQQMFPSRGFLCCKKQCLVAFTGSEPPVAKK